MKIGVYGAGQEVGRSAIMISSGNKNILMDCGIKVKDQDMEITGYPKLPANVHIDATIIGHAHLDHCSYFPFVYKHNKTPIFATSPTASLSDLLIMDAKKVDPTLPFDKKIINEAFGHFVTIPYELEHSVGDVKFTMHDAGHIPGSAMIEVKAEGKKVLYTSDFNTGDTRMEKGAKVVDDIDVLVIETTYGEREHQPREKVEKQLIKTIRDRLDEGGNVLLPCFAVQRTQEVAMILNAYNIDVPIYIHGMGKSATEIMLSYPRYLRSPGQLRAAFQNMIPVGRDRSVVTKEQSVIVATSGMMEGGPAISYLMELQKKKDEKQIESSLIFTGYCVEKTGGWYLQNKGMFYLKRRHSRPKPININIAISKSHLSAHSGRKELLEFIKKTNPQKIICVHGDNTPGFAAELSEKGYETYSPKNGQRIEV